MSLNNKEDSKLLQKHSPWGELNHQLITRKSNKNCTPRLLTKPCSHWLCGPKQRFSGQLLRSHWKESCQPAKRTDKEAFFKLEVDERLKGYRLGDVTVTSRGVEVHNPSLPPQLSCTVDFWEFTWNRYRSEMIWAWKQIQKNEIVVIWQILKREHEKSTKQRQQNLIFLINQHVV